MSEGLAITQAVAREFVRQPTPTTNRPDAPARENVSSRKVETLASDVRAQRPATAEQSTSRPRQTAELKGADSGLTTYRDSDSGRLIVRIFDKETGDVLLEFPPEEAPQSEIPSAGRQPVAPRTTIDV